MNKVAKALIWLLITVTGAHALSYAAVQLLPDPVVSVLGLQSSSSEARAALADSRPVRSYRQIVCDLAHGDLGETRDGVPVQDELGSAIGASLPRLAAAAVLIVGMAVGTAFLPRGALRPVAISASFVTFIPPFFAPYLLLWANVRLQEQYSQDPQSLAWWLCALSVAAPAGAFAASQAALITLRNLRLPFVLTIRAVGASEARVRVRLLHHLLVESAPTFEKIAIGMVTALLFAEATFSQSGFGAMILRAIRRTDVDLIIVATTLLAATTALLRLFTMELRASYGLVSR